MMWPSSKLICCTFLNARITYASLNSNTWMMNLEVDMNTTWRELWSLVSNFYDLFAKVDSTNNVEYY